MSPRRTTATSPRPEGTAASSLTSPSVCKFEQLLSEFARQSILADREEDRKQKSFAAYLEDYGVADKQWRDEQKATADDFNLLEVLGLTGDELSHSMLLAWLLDRDILRYGTHAQGSLGFRLFLEECSRRVGKHRMDTRYADMEYYVRREVAGDESRVDIRVESPGSFLIDIENKVFSQEGERQTTREWRGLQAHATALGLAQRNVHAFFLTPDGRSAADGRFQPISYRLIVRVLDRFVDEAKPVDVRLFAKHYAVALRRYIISESGAKTEEEHEELVEQT